MGATHFNIADFSPLRFADELLLASVAPDRQPFAPCSLRLRGVCIHNFVAEQWTQLPFLGFSRMRSGGFSFSTGVWGYSCSRLAVVAFATVRSRALWR